MNFAFGVVCKVLNSFAKSKNSSTPKDFALRLGKPKVWTPPPNFFSPIAPARFFPSPHFDVRRACQSPPVAAQLRSLRQSPLSPGRVRRSSPSSFASVRLRPPPSGRAHAAGRTDGRREIARGGGAGGRSLTWKAEIVDAK